MSDKDHRAVMESGLHKKARWKTMSTMDGSTGSWENLSDDFRMILKEENHSIM